MPPVPDPAVPAGVVAKAFLGGPLSDYQVVLGKGGTLLSEHIRSGKKVPAVEVGNALKSTLSHAAQFTSLGRGGLIAAAAAVTSGVAIYEVRKLRRQIAAELATEPEPGAPILTPEATNSPLLVSTERNGLDEVAVPVLLASKSTPRMRRSRPARVGAEAGTDGSLALDAMPAGDHPRDGHGPDEASPDEAQTVVGVDLIDVTPNEVARARAEHDAGHTNDAVDRLRRLLRFLDELLGKSGSPAYPAITREPLSTLIELAQTRTDEPNGVSVSAHEIADWKERVGGLDQTEKHDSGASPNVSEAPDAVDQTK